MIYRTAIADEAEKFNGEHHANTHASNGFIAVELPVHARKAGKTHALQDITGDYISDLKVFIEHKDKP